MELDEIKKIWDTQNNQYMYSISEQTMHNLVISKKNKTVRITEVSELLLVAVNLGSGLIVSLLNMSSSHQSIALYIMAGWMLLSGIYILVNRVKRLRGNLQFDRSVLGDLNYAVSIAMYQVRLSQIGRWNIVPIALMSMIAMAEGGKPAWTFVPVIVVFLLSFFVSRWEHSIYISRKNELEALQKKLAEQK